MRGGGREESHKAQTAAIMQPSKSYYHCNGTDGVGVEKMCVWEEGRETMWEGAPSLSTPERNTHTHTPILLPRLQKSSEVTPPCRTDAPLKMKYGWRSGDF